MKNFTVPVPGFYRHYKGGRYLVLGFGDHTDIMGAGNQLHVIYYSLDYKRFWLRSLPDFLAPVKQGDALIQRFHLVKALDLEPLPLLLAQIGTDPGYLERIFK